MISTHITVNEVEKMVEFAKEYLRILVDNDHDYKELVEIAEKIKRVETKVDLLKQRSRLVKAK